MILWTYLLIKELSWFYITSQNVVIPFDLFSVRWINCDSFPRLRSVLGQESVLWNPVRHKKMRHIR